MLASISPKSVVVLNMPMTAVLEKASEGAFWLLWRVCCEVEKFDALLERPAAAASFSLSGIVQP